MSKRRKAQEVIIKKAHAGFVGMPLFCQIMPESDDDYESCCLDCGDPDCRTWNNLSVVGTGKMCYHVSECQMEDLTDSDIENWLNYTDENRCAGGIYPEICKVREQCKRYQQIFRDKKAGVDSYSGLSISIMTRCENQTEFIQEV